MAKSFFFPHLVPRTLPHSLRWYSYLYAPLWFLGFIAYISLLLFAARFDRLSLIGLAVWDVVGITVFWYTILLWHDVHTIALWKRIAAFILGAITGIGLAIIHVTQFLAPVASRWMTVGVPVIVLLALIAIYAVRVNSDPH